MPYERLKLHDGMSLGTFSHLRTLALRDVCIEVDCLCSALGAMPLLADLSLFDVSFFRDAALPTSHRSMTQLTSFEFQPVFGRGLPLWHWIEAATRGFTQLTRFSFEFPTPTYGLPSSQTITHLTVHMFRPMATEQLLQMAENLTRLECLEIHNQREACHIPSRMFLRMESLRSLSLMKVDVDVNLFEALASLKHLTEFRLWCHADAALARFFRFYGNANRLQNLLFLRLDILDPYRQSVLECLSGVQLSRLQVLELPRCRLDDDQKNHIFSRFPSLRRFLPY